MNRLVPLVVSFAALATTAMADDSPLSDPLWPPLSDSALSMAMDAAAGCDGPLRQAMGQTVSPEDLARTCAVPIDMATGRLIAETGRLTGLLELCGAPDRDIFLKEISAVLDRPPAPSLDVVYYQGVLHGLARGMSRNGLAGAGVCARNDPAESAHYQTIAAKHFRQFVLPLPRTAP